MIEYLGFLAGAIGVAAYLPQVVKTWRTRETKGLSLGLIALTFTSAMLWLTYGFLKPAWPLVFTNASMIVLTGTIIVLFLVSRKGKPSKKLKPTKRGPK